MATKKTNVLLTFDLPNANSKARTDFDSELVKKGWTKTKVSLTTTFKKSENYDDTKNQAIEFLRIENNCLAEVDAAKKASGVSKVELAIHVGTRAIKEAVR